MGRGRWGGGKRGGGDGEGEQRGRERQGWGFHGDGYEVLAMPGSGHRLTWRVRLGGGNAEGEGGRWEGGDGPGATGRGGWGSGQRGGGEKGARGEGISQMDMMKSLDGMRLQSFLTLFTRATPGTPASLY